jgi:ankyrin repeat protein
MCNFHGLSHFLLIYLCKLHWNLIAAYKHYDIVQLLLENGADINIVSNSGNSPLMKAVEKGNDKVAKLLIDKGAKIDLVNRAGLTAMGLAKRDNRHAIVQQLKGRAKQDQITTNALLRSVEIEDQIHLIS